VFEVQDYGQPRLKVGIKYLNEESDIGVLVLHVFEKYPFDKAGVLKGDRILEIAHRQVKDFQDIKYVLLKFKQGTEIPIRVKRGDKTLLLTLLIE
jgi:S1-C subfamily serine protease